MPGEITAAELRRRYAKGDRGFASLRLPAAEFTRATLSEANFTEGQLAGANFTEANLTRANLSDGDLTEANFAMCTLAWANLAGAKLSGANLSGAQLPDANLKGADLSDADLTGANLTMANLAGANLRSANLSMANLTGANLSEADLTWADLKEANLTRADLTGANLTEPSLIKANLDRANLTRAVLTGADLSSANLRRANLTDADLTDAHLQQAILIGAKLDRTSGVRLDGTHTRDAGFSAWARDPWSQLRRSYSGPMTALHLFVLASFLAPYAASSSWWHFMSRAVPSACAAPECQPYLFSEALLGVNEGRSTWVLGVVLLAYNLVRLVFTFWVGLLNSAEERSGVSPLFRDYRVVSFAHRFVMRPVIAAALIYFAIHMAGLLQTVVHLPAPRLG